MELETSWPGDLLKGFSDFLLEKISEIPIDFINNAKISIDTKGHYSRNYPCIKISYERPESDEEMFMREDHDRKMSDFMKENELRTLAQLKAKYET